MLHTRLVLYSICNQNYYGFEALTDEYDVLSNYAPTTVSYINTFCLLFKLISYYKRHSNIVSKFVANLLFLPDGLLISYWIPQPNTGRVI